MTRMNLRQKRKAESSQPFLMDDEISFGRMRTLSSLSEVRTLVSIQK